jgi:DNA repair ATPase RecN
MTTRELEAIQAHTEEMRAHREAMLAHREAIAGHDAQLRAASAMLTDFTDNRLPVLMRVLDWFDANGARLEEILKKLRKFDGLERKLDETVVTFDEALRLVGGADALFKQLRNRTREAIEHVDGVQASAGVFGNTVTGFTTQASGLSGTVDQIGTRLDEFNRKLADWDMGRLGQLLTALERFLGPGGGGGHGGHGP